MTPLMTVAAASKATGLTPGTIRRWIRERRVKSVKDGDTKQAAVYVFADSLLAEAERISTRALTGADAIDY